MANGIDKKALFNLKSEPYLRPISDLGVGFYNLDENTAILRFQLSNAKGPLLIHENNLTAYAYFESSNGSVSDVIELEIEDSFNGIVTITLDKEFLQASTSTKVKGQVYIGVNNVDGNPEYNEVAVFREFTFEVADALINKISSFTKIEYIRMFDQLKMRIEQKVRDIEEAIANGADYVAEMKAVLQQGIETLNAIVADGKTDIQAFITQAKTDLTKVKDDATSDITTTANNAKTSVQDTASTAVSSIDSKTTEATEHVDAKVTEFNKTVEDNGFLTPDKLTEDLTALNWQKYKLTNNDGTLLRLDLNSNLDVLYAANIGSYYATGVPISNASSTAGLLTIEMNIPKNVKFITFRPFNSTQIWLKRFYNTWSEWERVGNTQTDTGWMPITIKNGYNKYTIPDFEPSYRVIDYGTHKKLYVRLGVTNLTNGKNTVASIPTELNPYKIYSLGVSTIAKIPPKVVVSGGNIEVHPNSSDSYIDTDYVIYQDEWII